jgi:hypothetical protein
VVALSPTLTESNSFLKLPRDAVPSADAMPFAMLANFASTIPAAVASFSKSLTAAFADELSIWMLRRVVLWLTFGPFRADQQNRRSAIEVIAQQCPRLAGLPEKCSLAEQRGFGGAVSYACWMPSKVGLRNFFDKTDFAC